MEINPIGTDNPRDPEYAPLMLRRQLGGNRFRFPLFDFAYIWYLHATRQLSPARLGVFPTDEISLIGAVVDAVSKHPFECSCWGGTKCLWETLEGQSVAVLETTPTRHRRCRENTGTQRQPGSDN